MRIHVSKEMPMPKARHSCLLVALVAFAAGTAACTAPIMIAADGGSPGDTTNYLDAQAPLPGPCGANGECPSGLVCVTENVPPVCAGFDAQASPVVVDAQAPPTELDVQAPPVEVDAQAPPTLDAQAPSPGACVTSADCPGGQVCAFAEVGGCGAVGACMPSSGIVCPASYGCACDGTIINVDCAGLPIGYSYEPLRFRGGLEVLLSDGCGDAGAPR